ncbi:MAG: hypothetical protein LLG04_15955 [Parachlamydia sp.]|nr:hypothetical protein [Parachlamydia sp.]
MEPRKDWIFVGSDDNATEYFIILNTIKVRLDFCNVMVVSIPRTNGVEFEEIRDFLRSENPVLTSVGYVEQLWRINLTRNEYALCELTFKREDGAQVYSLIFDSHDCSWKNVSDSIIAAQVRAMVLDELANRKGGTPAPIQSNTNQEISLRDVLFSFGAYRNKIIIITSIPFISVLAIIAIFLINYIQLQMPMNDVLSNDQRNAGIRVSVHYKYFIYPGTLTYNLSSVSGKNSMADVFRVLLQFADKIQSKRFDLVELGYKSSIKFQIRGEYFQTLGKEYSWQNPIYTMRTFPENVLLPNGSRAYPVWKGGWLGIMMKQTEDFNDFHKRWYLEERLGT